MGYRAIASSLLSVGKVASQLLIGQSKNNFDSHQSRILSLEATSRVLAPGFLVDYVGDTAPAGWLLADGSVVSRTTYADLFAICGTAYNTGGEAGTDFRLPNKCGRVSVGKGTGVGLTLRALGASGGEETHQLSTGELPVHTHTLTDPGHSHPTSLYDKHGGGGGVTTGWPGGSAPVPSPALLFFGSNTTGATINNAGGAGSHNNVQPSIVFNVLIKT